MVPLSMTLIHPCADVFPTSSSRRRPDVVVPTSGRRRPVVVVRTTLCGRLPDVVVPTSSRRRRADVVVPTSSRRRLPDVVPTSSCRRPDVPTAGAQIHMREKILQFSIEITAYLGNGTRYARGYYGTLIGSICVG